MKQALKLSLTALLTTTLLTGCDILESDDDSPKSPSSSALVQTKAPDYSSSEVVAVDIENEIVSSGYYTKQGTDFTLVVNDDEVYHIGRFYVDTVEKYSNGALESQIWSYSTQDAQQVSSSNPYTMAFVSDTKAYLIRYGSDKVWIVNPQAEFSEDFKIGELDLSAYVEENFEGTPNPSEALIHDDKLFIVMQRMDANYAPNTAYVAVFDINTDEEIETNAFDGDTVKGVPLAGLNPLENSLFIHEDELFVTSRARYYLPTVSNSKIEAINLNDYSVREVVSGTSIDAPIKFTVIIDDNQGYFISNPAGYDENNNWVSTAALFEFNPTTGEIVEQNIAGTGSEDISYIKLDDNGFLWMSVIADQVPGIDILNTSDNTKYTERLLTELNPATIVFLDE